MTGWMEAAACAGRDTSLWFATSDSEATAIAKLICGDCQVRDVCLDNALATGQHDGVLGGLAGPERRRLAKRRGIPAHGTISGYTNDGCRCGTCLTERREYDRDRRAAAARGSVGKTARADLELRDVEDRPRTVEQQARADTHLMTTPSSERTGRNDRSTGRTDNRRTA